MFIVHLDYTDWYLGVISPGGRDREIIEGLLVFSFPTDGPMDGQTDGPTDGPTHLPS